MDARGRLRWELAVEAMDGRSSEMQGCMYVAEGHERTQRRKVYMVFEIQNKLAGPRQITQSVLQICDMLGMYQAELARILHLQCGDIGQLANAKAVLEQDSESWQQAGLFLEFYQLLYQYFEGDGVAMRNWLRKENKELGGSPLLIMVDDLNIEKVIHYFKRSSSP